jgi:DNA topoisomerase IA
MRLFIAEKPSVAKTIAGELGGEGRSELDGFLAPASRQTCATLGKPDYSAARH